MSSPSSRWFHQGTDPGTIITLDQPVPSQWKILGKLNERNFQASEEMRRRHGHYSYATAKLLCCDPKKPSRKAFMRVYLQVPFKNTEIQDPKTRSRQATTYTPPDLTAYQEFTQKDFSNVPKLLGYKVSTQDKSGLVPNGFAIWLAWEMVPGLRLGDKLGNDPYWTLSAVEREHVHMDFMKALPQALEKGYGPYTPSLSKLVWHSQTGTLYFIGYTYGINDEPKDRSNIKIGPEAVARYGLAKPSSNEWRNKNWNGDTTGWKM
ncbi:hypothetical protein IFM61606_04833 [Aspergillus udagawae]|uniref:Uncharacterized protein n=1 Tax=Aspergillus udagawae TaxID=91492 RepID=A0ABQ1AN06_9EURO|nr:hypothetical protein IFM51744_04716 [Aspergillus udagawae]GFF84913.1 hypothetical protein IFM53868_04306 [Aspergillus udagawae]GFG24909.1 hypothetical protein IFM61606_04833 [Aspergillus udagawae]